MRESATLSYASIMGLRHAPSSNKLESGINLTGDQYQWLGSLFYFGYIAWEYPTTRLLQRLPLGKYSAFNIIMWVSKPSTTTAILQEKNTNTIQGLVLSCFAAVENYAGAIVIRFFLGVFESAVSDESSVRIRLKTKLNTGHSRLRTLHIPMVHKERAGFAHRYLVQLQWVCPDLRWLRCVRHRGRLPQVWHRDRTLEDHLPCHWPSDNLCWPHILVDHA
jgi:hypothetical protein